MPDAWTAVEWDRFEKMLAVLLASGYVVVTGELDGTTIRVVLSTCRTRAGYLELRTDATDVPKLAHMLGLVTDW